jgi:flagellar FliL protein
MKKPIVKILIMVFAGLGILVFSVITSRALVKKMFFTPEIEEPVHEEKPEFGQIYMIDDLVINPAQSGGRRHLLVSLGLEYHEEHGHDGGGHGGGEGELSGVAAELQQREPQLRDNLITLLAGQDISVLSDIKYREKIRKSLLKAINYYLHGGKVDKLYFTKYVFQ